MIRKLPVRNTLQIASTKISNSLASPQTASYVVRNSTKLRPCIKPAQPQNATDLPPRTNPKIQQIHKERRNTILQLQRLRTQNDTLAVASTGSFFSLALILSYFSSNSSTIETEKERMKKRLEKHGFIELEMAHDGNCMMRAISHQLFGTQEKYKEVRTKISGWLQLNEQFDVDGNGTQISQFIDTDEYASWSAYCSKLSRDGIWGDHLALVAAAQVFAKRIWILSSVVTAHDADSVTVIEPLGVHYDQTLFLSHWHENHYNSLQAANSSSNVSNIPPKISTEGENIQ